MHIYQERNCCLGFTGSSKSSHAPHRSLTTCARSDTHCSAQQRCCQECLSALSLATCQDRGLNPCASLGAGCEAQQWGLVLSAACMKCLSFAASWLGLVSRFEVQPGKFLFPSDHQVRVSNRGLADFWRWPSSTAGELCVNRSIRFRIQGFRWPHVLALP